MAATPDPRPRLWIDIETYSPLDLKKTNVYRYAAEPDFEILMAAWSTDGETVNIALGEAEVKNIPGLWDTGVLKVAHNAQFERVCFSRLAGLPVGEYLDPDDYHDTMAVAAELGYPRNLGKLARALGAEEKDEAGTRLINLFCKPQRGRRLTATDKPAEWLDFIAYCEQDVHTLIDVDRRLGWWPTLRELQIFRASERVNDLGIKIDMDMVRNAYEATQSNGAAHVAELQQLMGVDNPNSQPQMMEGFKRLGLELKNLRAETIDAELERDDLTDDQRRALSLRKELAMVAAKKYSAAMRLVCPDGRLRGAFQFFGAHTGRWAGRGVQLQNLPRESFMKVDPATGDKVYDFATQEATILDLAMGLGADPTSLKALVRPMFYGPFTVVDYAAIEARVIAWLAGEQWALDAFAEGRDIYVETAERMSTPGNELTRAQGKVAVLALGYQGSIGSLRAMGAEGDDEELYSLVHQWRAANPRIVRLWRTMQDAISDGGRVGPKMRITRDGEDMQIHLPSGRAITYHGMRWDRNYRVKDKATGRWVVKTGWRYDDPAIPGQRIGTYGGRLVENVTQAVARDVMAEAIVRLQREGYCVVGHVHDEVITEGIHPVQEVSDIMCSLSKWASGLPIDGAGFVTTRYRKD